MIRSAPTLHRLRFPHWTRIWVPILVLFLVIGPGYFAAAPGLAQTDLEAQQSADVVLDGRPLFQISGNDRDLASDRVDDINQRLQDAVESGRSPRLRVENEEGEPVEIYLNDEWLLSIRRGDIETPGLSSEEQALVWADEIEEAIRQAQQERSFLFRWRAILISVVVVIIRILIHGVLGRVRRKLPQWTERALSSYQFLDQEHLQTVERVLTLGILFLQGVFWIGAILFVANLFPRTRQISYFILNAILSSFTTSFLSVGSESYSIVDFLILIALISGLFALSGVMTNILRARILSVTGIQRGAQEAIAISAKYGFIVLGLLVVLQAWGIDLSSLTILASAIGFGVGFGFQNIARNLSSGLVLLFERPIQVGDFVEVGNYVGTVEHIGARRTLIRTLDRVSIIVPNSRFLEEEVINWSHENPVSRLHLPVGVAYSSDVNQVRSALLEAATEQAEVLPIPAPSVLFKGFGDSAMDFELLVWIRDPSRQPVIKSDLYFLIEAALRRYGIEIPFPQRDLHMRSGMLPLQFSPQLEQTLVQLLSRISSGEGSPPNGAGRDPQQQ